MDSIVFKNQYVSGMANVDSCAQGPLPKKK